MAAGASHGICWPTGCWTSSCCRSRPSWRAPAGVCSTTPATSSGCGSPTARPSRPAPCGCSSSRITPDRSYNRALLPMHLSGPHGWVRSTGALLLPLQMRAVLDQPAAHERPRREGGVGAEETHGDRLLDRRSERRGSTPSRVSMSSMAIERSAGRRLTDAFLACDALAMVAELAPDAVFHSPVADYEGRDRIGAVLTAVTQVVAVPRPSHLIEASDETLLAFIAEF